MAYRDVILATPGLVSYWRLGEPSGNALDSKNANHGTVAGGITRQAAGLLSGDADAAVRGDGAVGSWITVPHNANMNTGAKLSYECWLKAEANPARSIMVRGAHVLSITTGTTFRFAIRDDVFTDIAIVAPNNTLKLGQRQHVVATYEAGAMKIYVDGVSVGATPSPVPSRPLEAATAAFNMLASSAAGASVQGTLDEAAFYNVALTPAQVLEHFVAGSSGVPISGTLTLTGSRIEIYNPGADRPTGSIMLSGSIVATAQVVRAWGTPIRERPPLRHHVDAIAPSGRHYRWANDEPDAQNVPGNLRWGSTMPGGYESCDCVLPRKPGVDYSDLERYTTLRVINSGGSSVGEYRLERTPQTSGDQMAITPSAVGWQAHLDDNKAVSVVFIDRELGGWVGPNSQRRLTMLTGLIDPLDPSNTPADDGLPSLLLALQGAISRRANCEAYYFLPAGEYLGRLKFDWQASASISIADPNWIADFHTSVAAGHGGFTTLIADWMTALAGSVNSDTSAIALANRRAAMLRLAYTAGPFGADNVAYEVHLRNLRVFGNHGLPIRGSTPGGEGFFATDMITYAVNKWAPMLKMTADSIQPTNFVIPQGVFRDTTVSEIVKQATRFGLDDWAVWNNKILYLNPRNANPISRKWRARIGPAKLEETGKQADRLWESVIVQYNDVDGSERTVGPPGSGSDTESSYLKDLDPENPANILGITRRDKLVMGVSTPAGAIEVGRRFLEEQKLIDRSGRATLVGHVEDNHGVLFPFSEVQAGDAITFVDAADTSYRRIVKADHDNGAKSVSVDLDAPPEGLQAVLERLAVVLVPLGL